MTYSVNNFQYRSRLQILSPFSDYQLISGYIAVDIYHAVGYMQNIYTLLFIYTVPDQVYISFQIVRIVNGTNR